MLVATKDFVVDGERVVRGRTRIASDHPWARKFRSSFVDDPDGPPSASDVRYTKSRAHVREGRSERSSTRPSSRSRMPLPEEDRRRRSLISEFDAEDRVESESGRRQRVFWSGAQDFLDSLKDPAERERDWREAREDAEAEEITQALAKLARAQLEEIDAAWGDAAPWN